MGEGVAGAIAGARVMLGLFHGVTPDAAAARTTRSFVRENSLQPIALVGR
jgi:hypothetical protein